MLAYDTGPTSYPDINALLHALLLGVQAALGDYFVGLYLHGSLASGDFDPARSDIDFLVVTTVELSDDMLPVLQTMHARIAASGLHWATRLEGSYIPLDALRRYDPKHARHPALRMDGSFAIDHHGSDWVILCHLIREQGIAVAGPAPRTLIDPVEPNDLRKATMMALRGWWSQQLRDPVRLHSREYQAYAVLTMCRALYTLERGAVVSKPVAARWAQETLDAKWTALIRRAWAWRHDDGFDDISHTLDLIRYAIQRSDELNIPLHEA